VCDFVQTHSGHLLFCGGTAAFGGGIAAAGKQSGDQRSNQTHTAEFLFHTQEPAFLYFQGIRDEKCSGVFPMVYVMQIKNAMCLATFCCKKMCL
jgi:hypothetical protein